MKKILFLLLFFPTISKSQTLSYFSGNKSGNWQNFTFIVPPGLPDSAKVFYTSNNSKLVERVVEIKDISKDGVSASVINIGKEKINYLLILDKDFKHLIFTDDKQRLTTIFDLDSSIYNPPVAESSDYSGTAKMLLNAFKFLLL